MTTSPYKLTQQLALLTCLFVTVVAVHADTVTVTYTGDTTTNFPNPERGFYPAKDQYTTSQRWLTDSPVAGIDMDPATLRAQGVSLIRPIYNFSLYRSGNTTATPSTAVGSEQLIPQDYLDRI